MVVCAFREIKEASVTKCGNMMRLFEVASIFLQIVVVIQTINAWMQIDQMELNIETAYPPCAYDSVQRRKWIGNCKPWFILEVTVNIFYTFTLLIMMVKSRFYTIGMDQNDQFDPLYMSFMINRICSAIDFDLLQNKRTFAQTKKKFVNKKRKVVKNGARIYIKLTEKAYDSIFRHKVLDHIMYVPPEEAAQWITENVVGGYSRYDLDFMRYQEVMSLDLLVNAGIVYHLESITETQTFGLCMFYYLQNKSGFDSDGQVQILFMMLLIEHIFVYFSQLYRVREIAKRGKLDFNGIRRAKNESMLKTMQIIYDCIVLGYALNYWLTGGRTKFQTVPYANFWIMFDLLVMIALLAYTYMSQFMMITGEVTKNLYSLAFLQINTKRGVVWGPQKKDPRKLEKVANNSSDSEDFENNLMEIDNRSKQLMIDH